MNRDAPSNKLRLLLAFLRSHKRRALCSFLLDLLANACVIALSLLMAQTISVLFGFNSIRGRFIGLASGNIDRLFVLLFSLILVKLLLDFGRLWLRGTLSEAFAHQLRSLAFAQHLRADFRYHESRARGKSLLRFSGDLGSAQRLLTHGVLQYAADLALILMGILFMAQFDARLSFLVAGLTVTGWLLNRIINAKMRHAEAQRRSKKAGLLAHVSDTLQYLPAILVFNRSPRVLQRFAKKSELVRELGNRYRSLAAASEALPIFFVQLLLVSVLLVGWKWDISGSSLFAIVLVLMTWRTPLSRILRAGAVWKKGVLSLEKLELLLRSPMAVEGNGVLKNHRACTLRLQNVHLRFGQKTVLKDISFHLSQGETICLSLRTGGGKTVLTKLIAGLYLPDSGSIECNGQPVESFTAQSLRRQISFVSEAFPLAGKTLLDALSNSSKPTVLARAKREFQLLQTSFPMLQNLDIQEKNRLTATSLSSGQQRILQCLRAVLTDKPFLVLDEPFAGLDLETVKVLARLLDKYREGRGVLLLTSRPDLLAEISWDKMNLQDLG